MRIFHRKDSTAIELPTAELVEYLKLNLSRKRFSHCLRVADTATELSMAHGVDEQQAYFAGLCHDLAREFPAETLREIAVRDTLPFSQLEQEKPLLLHGRAAAVILSGQFRVTSTTVLDAVRHHTLGRPGFGPLGKVLYLSDYIEPKRGFVSTKFRKDISKMTLDSAVVAIIDHATQRGKRLAEPTRAMYDELKDGGLLQ